jgi:hypothetical protein
MDGPGFDAMDVPGGASVPKLQFTIFVPTAEFFRTLRTSQASLDLQDNTPSASRTAAWSASAPLPGCGTS